MRHSPKDIKQICAQILGLGELVGDAVNIPLSTGGSKGYSTVQRGCMVTAHNVTFGFKQATISNVGKYHIITWISPSMKKATTML